MIMVYRKNIFLFPPGSAMNESKLEANKKVNTKATPKLSLSIGMANWKPATGKEKMNASMEMATRILIGRNPL